MRNWLQRSQSHNEVNNDDVVDRGRYQIPEKHLLRKITWGNYVLNFKTLSIKQIRRKHFVFVIYAKEKKTSINRTRKKCVVGMMSCFALSLFFIGFFTDSPCSLPGCFSHENSFLFPTKDWCHWSWNLMLVISFVLDEPTGEFDEHEQVTAV